MGQLLAQLNQHISEVILNARRSLVYIENERQGHGAGTIWHPNGMILTNAHVVQGSSNLRVTLSNGEQLSAQLIAQNPEYDLAVLGIPAENLPTLELGDSKKLVSGEWVMAVGHPWGVVGAVTSGTVIGMSARLPDMPAFKRDWIAVNLAMRPGHSGGALLNSMGQLLGVNTMISGPEVGYAVPVHVVKQFLKQTIV